MVTGSFQMVTDYDPVDGNHVYIYRQELYQDIQQEGQPGHRR